MTASWHLSPVSWPSLLKLDSDPLGARRERHVFCIRLTTYQPGTYSGVDVHSGCTLTSLLHILDTRHPPSPFSLHSLLPTPYSILYSTPYSISYSVLYTLLYPLHYILYTFLYIYISILNQHAFPLDHHIQVPPSIALSPSLMPAILLHSDRRP